MAVHVFVMEAATDLWYEKDVPPVSGRERRFERCMQT